MSSARRPESPVTLRVFGRLAVEGGQGTGPEALSRQPKRAAVLAFILLEGRGDFVDRARVVAHFWPSTEKRRARSSLRQAVRFIRSTLGAEVVESRGHHEIRVPPVVVSCDAIRFDALLAKGRFEDALALYRGPLTVGAPVESGSALTEWIEAQRVHFRHGAVRAAWALAEQAEEQGRTEDAAFWAKRGLSLSPFDEGRVRRLIAFLDRVGDHAGALRAYRGLAAKLKKDAGTRPSRATEELASAVRARARASGALVDRAGSDRRGSEDRRTGERRTRDVWLTGPDRRRTQRRTSERRSGRDRRDEESR